MSYQVARKICRKTCRKICRIFGIYFAYLLCKNRLRDTSSLEAQERFWNKLEERKIIFHLFGSVRYCPWSGSCRHKFYMRLFVLTVWFVVDPESLIIDFFVFSSGSIGKLNQTCLILLQFYENHDKWFSWWSKVTLNYFWISCRFWVMGECRDDIEFVGR